MNFVMLKKKKKSSMHSLFCWFVYFTSFRGSFYLERPPNSVRAPPKMTEAGAGESSSGKRVGLHRNKSAVWFR